MSTAETLEKAFKRIDRTSKLRLAYIDGCCRNGKATDLPALDESRHTLQSLCPKPPSPRRSISFVNDPSCDVSIIVPVYNTEQYIEDCLMSACGQQGDFTFEVVVINDGSTDASGSIIRDLAATEERITVVERENGGLSAARNSGMSICRGRYLCFLDSDDMLKPDHVSNLLHASERRRDAFASGVFTRMSESGNVGGPYEKRRTHGGACGRLFARTQWEDFCFPEGYLFEDTVIAYCMKSRYKELFSNDAGYLRRGRDTSITATASQSPRAIESYWIVEEMLDWCLDLSIPSEALYDQTLVQLGPVLFDRCRYFQDSVLKALFVVSRDLFIGRFSNVRIENLDRRSKILSRAFLESDYELWRLASRLL